jgi:hypothetical protein
MRSMLRNFATEISGKQAGSSWPDRFLTMVTGKSIVGGAASRD